MSRSPYGRILAALLTIAALAVGCQGRVTVPDVVGAPQADGESAIALRGLAVGSVTRRHGDVIGAGDILSQNPAGGAALPKGAAVDIVVSLGPPLAPVPDVTGMTEQDAAAALTALGLATGTVTPVYTNNPEDFGAVVDQSFAANQMAPPGTSIDLGIGEDDTPVRGFLERFAEDETTGLSDLARIGKPAMRFLIGQFTGFAGPDGGAAAAAALDIICSENRGLAAFAARELVGEMEACYSATIAMRLATAEMEAEHPQSTDVSVAPSDAVAAHHTQGKLAVSATGLALLGDAAVQAIDDRLADDAPVLPVDGWKPEGDAALTPEQVADITAKGTRAFRALLTRWRDEIAITGDSPPEHAAPEKEQE